MIWFKKYRWVLIPLMLIVLFSSYARFKIINGSLPYIGHPDEQALTIPAIDIIKTGDFNPHSFVWPSLPIYLAAASFVIGYVNSVSHGEIENTSDLGPGTYPYFSEKRVVFPAKLLFAMLSIIGVAFIGIIAYNIFPEKHLIYLSPLLLTLSSVYLYQSARYLNVDILGTSFAVLAVFYIIINLNRDFYMSTAIIPGILCGLSIASKYNYYLLLIPSVLAIILYSKKKRLRKIFLLILITVITFIACTPFSILDFSTFLDGIAFNISHYKKGHIGFTGTPGLPQFLYYCQALVDEYGLGLMAFAVLGIIFTLISKTKKGLVLISFPLLLLIYLSSLSVHFIRNILVIYVFVPIYGALGMTSACKYLRTWLKKIPFLKDHKVIHKVVPVLLSLAVISIFLPVKNIVSAYDLKPDSRNLSLMWIKANVLYNSIIFVPTELDLDTRELEENYEIKYYEGLGLTDDFQESIPGAYVLVPHYGYDPRGRGGKRVSSRLNASFKNIRKMVKFGKSPVLVNYPRPVPAGNPKFYIGKIRPSTKSHSSQEDKNG